MKDCTPPALCEINMSWAGLWEKVESVIEQEDSFSDKRNLKQKT